MRDRKPIVGGNWKMNTDLQSASELTRAVTDAMLANPPHADVVIFPPFPYLLSVRAILRDRGASIRMGAQDVYHKPNGAFTGEVSTAMLADCGAEVILVGHSERRHVLGEDDHTINAKTLASIDAGFTVMLCVGETLEQREAGQTDAVNAGQLKAGLNGLHEDHLSRIVIAYEPVWAIGTGRTASPEDAQDAHASLRDVLESLHGSASAERIRILYGGSVNAANARDLFAMPDIDGGLIGGASLKPADFVTIVDAASRNA